MMGISYVDLALVFFVAGIVLFVIFAPKVRDAFVVPFFGAIVVVMVVLPFFCLRVAADERRPVAYANSVCRPVLEKALSEYRADFGTDAVVGLSESESLVNDLARMHEQNGKQFGPYIYDEQIISTCSAHIWRVRPVTATTLHVDMLGFEANGKEEKR